MLQNIAWTEIYRPKNIDGCILTASARKAFNSFVKTKQIPHLLLSGRSGIGKTTVARALCEELGADYIIINSSLHGNIDTLRGEIKEFASTVSFSDADVKKYVILDEADGLSGATQQALRNFLDVYEANCGFILTCNYPQKIIKELHSRLTTVDMSVSKPEKAKLLEKGFKRVSYILDCENVEYDRSVLGNLLIQYFPDFRRLINYLQLQATFGPIVKIEDEVRDDFADLIELVKTKNFNTIRKWVAETQLSSTEVFRRFYDRAYDLMPPESIASLVILLGEYQYKQAFVADEEINLMAFLTQVMVECRFK